jgi:2-C-methyl-D-erythritol 4-phosphate cytidylyltransferase
MMTNTAVLIPAAGQSRRMGSQSKQHMLLNGRPCLSYSLECFNNMEAVSGIYIICRNEDRQSFEESLNPEKVYSKFKGFLDGGKERWESVKKGFEALPDTTEWVMIHDAARPNIKVELINKLLNTAKKTGAAALGVPARDTLKKVSDNKIQGTVDRSNLVQIQTPQVFKKEFLEKAYQLEPAILEKATDECYLMEALDIPITVVKGNWDNIKITEVEDIILMEKILMEKA